MAINWIEHPRLGTHVGNGEWLCTVEIAGQSLQVEILELEDGTWFRNVTEPLDQGRETVVAIAHVPEPYRD